MVHECETKPPPGVKAAAWQRAAFYDDEADRVYVPAAVVGNEAVMCALFDGVGLIREHGHVYLPADWLAREFPAAAEVCGLIERRVRRLYRGA